MEPHPFGLLLSARPHGSLLSWTERSWRKYRFHLNAHVAQWIERSVAVREVAGSIPAVRTMLLASQAVRNGKIDGVDFEMKHSESKKSEILLLEESADPSGATGT